VARLQQAAGAYQCQHQQDYFTDLLAAHAALGLLRRLSIPLAQQQQQQTAAAARPASSTSSSSSTTPGASRPSWPYKDMEMMVVGRHLCCPAFQRLLHIALRAMIDGCGSRTFNCGVLNLDLTVPPPAGVGMDRQFWSSSSSGRRRRQQQRQQQQWHW